MSKCARCDKTVYPMEELRCLDKVWHKPCFKCTDCGVVLNLQNYKGFDKIPYCRVHVPQPKATQVASTPEIKRATKISKMQSNVEYHALFEKTKGQYTPVSDTPESRRVKEAGILASNVTYHGDMQKKAIMDMKRQMGEAEIVNMKTSPVDETRHAPTLIFSSSTGPLDPGADQDALVGSIANYDAPNSPPPPMEAGPVVGETPVKISATKVDFAKKSSEVGKKRQQDANANYTSSPGAMNNGSHISSEAAYVSASTGINGPIVQSANSD